MSKYKKLELTWVGKDERPRLEPRILLPDDKFSYSRRTSKSDLFDNRLIFGDNLLALKALVQEYSGKIKCIFIDPPYNTKTAFTEYDDGIEHSLWLSLIRDRIELLRDLLASDGSIWISIDDNEAHYLKILCDEIFGRECFVASFIWRKVDSPNDNKVPITPDHEYIICYSKTPNKASLKPKFDPSILDAYNDPDENSSRPYRDRLLKKNGKNSLRTDRPSMYFKISDPDGNDVYPIHDDGVAARWAMGKDTVSELVKNNELIWKKRINKGKDSWVPYTREFAPGTPSRPYPTIWSDLDTTRQTKAHQKDIFGDAVVPFSTPKPEDLLSRIITISTNPGDIVLDSFSGSGTTGAVSHKMGRRWIMIELGDHCQTHIIPRLKKVIDGRDPGGVTDSTGWNGGGGFRFYRLAPSLLKKDEFGNWIINDGYNPEMLAEAVCKLEGFSYAPSSSIYWQHGQSTEHDFIYVTTQTLTHAQLHALSEAVGKQRTLLVMCSACRGNVDSFTNLTIKKIPKAVQDKCEWNKDDYSLAVTNAQVTDADDDDEENVEPASSGDDESESTSKSAVAKKTSVKKKEKPAATKRGSKKPKTHDNDQQTLI